jgi:hypothetical protein
LEFALETPQFHGVWGGMSERERLRIGRQRRRVRVATPIKEHGTDAGYAAHIRRGEEACGPCRDAHRRHRQTNRPSRARLTVVQ